MALRYGRALVYQFRWTLVAICFFLVLGTMLHRVTPQDDLEGMRPSWLNSLYATWMAMLAQPEFQHPETWYLTALNGFYPVVGFVLIGEGVVRLALLISSRERGASEWMRVMSSTYRDHVILCGVGHLGYRVYEQLYESQTPMVLVEKDASGRFLQKAKANGTPVLIRDMTEDQTLIEAGVERARVIVIATNDDMANLEVALDSRRLNPKIRVLMRLYDQQIAAKIADSLTIDQAFSASALAAPIVAAMSLETKVMSSFLVNDVPTVAAEFTIESGSSLIDKQLSAFEKQFGVRVLSRATRGGVQETPPPLDALLHANDKLVIHCAAAKLANVAAQAKLVN
jgi:voltage-gated potassium channel